MIRIRIEHGNYIFRGLEKVFLPVNGAKKALTPGVVYECSLYRQFFTRERYSVTIRFPGHPEFGTVAGNQVKWWFRRKFIKTNRKVVGI